MKPKLIVVVGPTAVGKTELTVKLAKRYGLSIINTDSRQVFKETSIGTAKPSKEEMAGVCHYFVDDRSIHENFSAGHFEKEGLSVLEKEFKNKSLALASGGSGLYIQALCEGFDEIPKVDNDIRKKLNNKVQNEGIDILYKELCEVDSHYAEVIDPLNTQRIVRALEVYYATGIPFTEFRKGECNKRQFECIYIGLEREREELYERINARVDRMMDGGLLNEVKALIEWKHLNALQTVGYKEIIGHLEGDYDLTEAIRLLKRNTRRYAKRQLTWFKKKGETTWFHPNSFVEIIKYIDSQLDT